MYISDFLKFNLILSHTPSYVFIYLLILSHTYFFILSGILKFYNSPVSPLHFFSNISELQNKLFVSSKLPPWFVNRWRTLAFKLCLCSCKCSRAIGCLTAFIWEVKVCLCRYKLSLQTSLKNVIAKRSNRRRLKQIARNTWTWQL